MHAFSCIMWKMKEIYPGFHFDIENIQLVIHIINNFLHKEIS